MSSVSFTNILGILRQDLMERSKDMDVISNNVSNTNTPGFKGSRSNFQEIMGSEEKKGSNIQTTQTITQAGPAATTESALDVLVQGDGMFAVRLPDGSTGYTRDGRFLMDTNRRIVNASGYELVWNGQIPEGITDQDVIIQANGEIGHKITTQQVDTQQVFENGEWVEKPIRETVTENGVPVERDKMIDVTSWESFGKIDLYRFPNASGLKSYGNNVWTETANSGAAMAGSPASGNYGSLQSFAYEQSNTSMGEEMAHLIALQRGMQISIRTFQQTDRMIEQAIAMRR